MFTATFSPRFYETDAFGHVNNTVVTGWFETAREPIFRIFTPDMDIQAMKLILARVEVDYLAQIYYGSEVRVQTGIEKIGSSSFVVWHEAYQHDKPVARGKAVQVHFDHTTQRSSPLTEALRQALQQHLTPV